MKKIVLSIICLFCGFFLKSQAPFQISIFSNSNTAISRDLFGVAVSDLGDLSYRNNVTWNSMIEDLDFLHGNYTTGAENFWIHPVSATGYPTQIPMATNVGFGANLDEIFFYTNQTNGAYSLQQSKNATGLNFWTEIKNHLKAHGQKMIFVANVKTGTVNELAFYLSSLTADGIPWEINYGQEITLTGGEPDMNIYMSKVNALDNYVVANYPNAVRGINLSRPNVQPATWTNSVVAAWAAARGMQKVSQYEWLDANSTITNVDNYFQDINQKLRQNIQNNLSEIDLLRNASPNMKLHLAQFGINYQRSGYSPHTMLHMLIMWEYFFNMFEYNVTHGDFINSASFLMEESCVDVYSNADNQFNILGTSFVQQGAGDPQKFVLRPDGLLYKMLKTIYTKPNPSLLTTTLSGTYNDMKIVTVNTDSTRIYICNNGPLKTISSINLNGIAVTGNVHKYSAWGQKLYASIGNSQYINQFPTAVPETIQIEDMHVSPNTLTLQPNSITVITLSQATASFNIASTVCVGQSINLSPVSIGGPSAWNWTMSGGSPATSTLQNINTSFSSVGIHTITLLVSNSTGTSIPLTKTISVVANPTISVFGNTLVCLGNSATFTANGASSYTFSPGGTTTNPATFSPTITTNYTVTGMAINGCKSKTFPTIVVSTCTGINDNSAQSKPVLMYPNPTSDILNISLIDENNAESGIIVVLLDVMDKEVLRKTYSDSKFNIDIKEFSGGIYILKVKTDQREYIQKVIIQK